MSDEKEIAERLRRLESTLDRIDRRVALLYWICVLVLALYVVTALAALFVSGANAGASQFLFPACIVGAAAVVLLVKRRPEP